jgi:hypothetical protein
MTFYILLNQITTIFLSMNLLTTMSFDSEIISYLYGGGKGEIYFQVTNNNRTLAIKPLMEGGYSNLLVITKDKKYYFNINKSKGSPHQFIEIKDGIATHSVTKKINKSNYEILEGKKAILFINKSKHSVNVNGTIVKSREYFSKGVPLLLDGKRILN